MKMKAIQTSNAPEPVGPYNQAIVANDTLYVSGQIPLGPGSSTIDIKSIEGQTHQVLKNIGAILAEQNLTHESIVKCSIFMVDLDDFSKMNEVYAHYFSNVAPARECVEVKALPKGALIEISCIAVT